jgi:hypothetical protein
MRRTEWALLGILLAAAPAQAIPGQGGTRQSGQPRVTPSALIAPKLLARYFVGVRPDGATSASRTLQIKSKGAYVGPVTVVVQRVTSPSVPVATKSGNVGNGAGVSVELPANPATTPSCCLTGEHHYQVSIYAASSVSAVDPITASVQTSGDLQVCRGPGETWFNPAHDYPNGVPPGPGAAGAPPAYQKCLDANQGATPVSRPGQDPWPDPDPGLATDPSLSTCR